MGQRRAGGSVRRALAAARAAIDALITILLAPACAACDALLDRPLEGAVCDLCWHSIVPITPPVCDRCGDPLPTWRAISLSAGICPRCRRLPRAIDRARAIGDYDGALRAIVQALKYDKRRSVAKPLARLMIVRGHEMLESASCAVPVPLHASKRRARGFNQADDLARHLGIRVVHALKRTVATPTQTSLPAAQRHRNVKNVFRPTRAASHVRGAIVVLVDDVSTTGATLDACARMLKALGAREVRALTAARVVTGGATLSGRTTGRSSFRARNR